MSRSDSMLLDQPLPANLESERFVLGTAVSHHEVFSQISVLLSAEDFSLEKHKRIFLRMSELQDRGETITYASLAQELSRHNQLQLVDGLSYLVDLSCVPHLANLERFCHQVKSCAIRRNAITGAYQLIQRCYDDMPREEALADLERLSEVLNSPESQAPVAPTIEEQIAMSGGLNVFLHPETTPGIAVPFPSISETLGGLRRSKFIILGARPAVGKTALAAQIAEHAASNGHHVLLVTLEMSARDLIYRSITGRAQVSAYKFRRGELTLGERDSVMAEVSDLAALGSRLRIMDKSETTVQEIAAVLRSLEIAGNKVDLCIVDYLQLLSSVGRFDSRVQEVSAISRGLKRITQKFQIPLIALSQLARQEEHRKNSQPELHWLKESGQIEQDADQVLFLWMKKDPEEGQVLREISWRVAKNRDGILNNGTLDFHARYCRFEEIVADQRSAA